MEFIHRTPVHVKLQVRYENPLGLRGLVLILGRLRSEGAELPQDGVVGVCWLSK